MVTAALSLEWWVDTSLDSLCLWSAYSMPSPDGWIDDTSCYNRCRISKLIRVRVMEYASKSASHASLSVDPDAGIRIRKSVRSHPLPYRP